MKWERERINIKRERHEEKVCRKTRGGVRLGEDRRRE